MNLSCDRGDIAWEWLYVCREKLLDTSVFENLIDDRMLVGKSVQCVLVSRVVAHSALHLHLRVEVHLLIKKDSDLLRRHDVERRLLRHAPHVFLDFVHLGCKR